MRASFVGCPIDVLTMADTVELASSAMRSQQRLQHVALNVAKFVRMRFDPVLAADVASSDVTSIDILAGALRRAPVRMQNLGLE